MKKISPFTAIILAAGKGTRMVSNLPKVLHPVAGRSMIEHAIDTVCQLKPASVITVVAPGMDSVKQAALRAHSKCHFAVQDKQLGTGHAVRAALKAHKVKGNIIVLYADTPLITSQTLHHMLAQLDGRQKPAAAVLGMRPANPAEYGRLITGKKGELEAIVEYKDASAEQRAIGLCNSGVMAISGKQAALIGRIRNNNAKKEYYLTDVIALARKDGLSCAYVEADEQEVLGVNSRVELAQAERILQNRLRDKAMLSGATLLDPETTYFSYDTVLGKDTVIHPNVFFGPGVSVKDNVTIRSFCHLEGATVESNVIIGPFARLRPGAYLQPHVHIGNFVEIKNALVEHSAKINHLSYIGDAHIGENANIGAGTITCNYDGFNKFMTEIGANALIGSNTSLVAPVRIGKDAIVGAGSVITENVAPGDLGITRAPQVNKRLWAKHFRLRQKPRRH